MWYKCQNGSVDVKPAALDKESSKKYVYVRKDFTEIPASGEEGFEIPAHWEWMEMKIPKDDWNVYEHVLEHDAALDDVYAALTELADIIAGEE